MIARFALTSLVAVLTLSACDVSSASVNPTVPPNKGGASAIVLANTAPANIDLALTVAIIHPIPPEQARFQILPAFYYQQDEIIQFKQGEKFECSGVSVPTDSNSSYITFNIPAAGTVMNCTYFSPQGQASFPITIPAQARLVSPASGATVAISAQTPLTIDVVPPCKGVAIEVGYKNSQGEYVGGTQDAPDGCAAQQVFSTLNMATGPGMLGVEEVEKESAITNNAGFHSLTLMVMTRVEEPVTWH